MSVRGKRPEVVDAAVRSALRETVFRFELVLRINVTTHDLLERETLIDAALSAHLALLASEGRAARRADDTYLERLTTLRDLLTLRVSELRAAQGARASVEERYLAGHTALFPDAVRAAAAQLKSTEALAGQAVRLAELDGVPAAERVDPDVISTRATELVADLVEPAKSTAPEKLGEGRAGAGDRDRLVAREVHAVGSRHGRGFGGRCPGWRRVTATEERHQGRYADLVDEPFAVVDGFARQRVGPGTRCGRAGYIRARNASSA